MLHLRLSALCKKIKLSFCQRQLFLGQLFVLVLCAHLMIFALFTLSSKLSKKQDQFSISLVQSGLTYVLMPLQKSVDNADQINKKRCKSSQLKSKVIDYETYRQQKKEELRKKRLKAQQSLQPKKVSTKKRSCSVQKSLSKVETLHDERKASLIFQSSQKSTCRKKLSSKKIAQAQQKKQKVIHVVSLEIGDIEIDYEDLVSQSTLEIEHVAQSVEQKIAQQPVAEETIPQQLSIHSDLNQNEISFAENNNDFENVVFVGYEQLDNSIIGSHIQQEILQHWNPPVGIPSGVTCELSIHVDGQGKADVIKITKSSGRLVYDVTARKAITSCVFPKEIWNKNNTITLGS